MSVYTLYNSTLPLSKAYLYLKNTTDEDEVIKFAITKSNKPFIISMVQKAKKLYSISAFTLVSKNGVISKNELAIADIQYMNKGTHLAYIGIFYDQDKHEGIGSMLLRFVEEQAYKNKSDFISLMPLTHAVPFYIENEYTKHIDHKNKTQFGKSIHECFVYNNYDKHNMAYVFKDTKPRLKAKLKFINDDFDLVHEKEQTQEEQMETR